MCCVQKVVSEHDIDNIFCACQDGDDLTVFAYITRDLMTEKHHCHVFRVESTVCTDALRHFTFWTSLLPRLSRRPKYRLRPKISEK